MSPEERKRLVDYRLSRAYETLREAKGSADLGFWNTAMNRLFYAAFQAATALLVAHGREHKTHKGTRNALTELTNGVVDVPKDLVRFYDMLSDRRQDSDYDDFFTAEAEEIQPLIAPTEELIKAIERVIARMGSSTEH